MADQITVLGRASIYVDAYGNLQATEAIFAEAKKRGFDESEMIFAGDGVV